MVARGRCGSHAVDSRSPLRSALVVIASFPFIGDFADGISARDGLSGSSA